MEGGAGGRSAYIRKSKEKRGLRNSIVKGSVSTNRAVEEKKRNRPRQITSKKPSVALKEFKGLPARKKPKVMKPRNRSGRAPPKNPSGVREVKKGGWKGHHGAKERNR